MSKYVSLLPRKPSQAFINTFQVHSFNDNLRPNGHKNKGKSFGHYEEGKA
jgi:hypothetical protein